MKTFDEQIKASAQRCRKADSSRLETPVCPKVYSPASKWRFATPAAAVAGLLFGWLLASAPYADHTRSLTACVHDTIVQERTVRDTIWVPQPYTVQPVRHTVHSSPARATVPARSGRSIREDGIDYSLFVTGVEI